MLIESMVVQGLQGLVMVYTQYSQHSMYGKRVRQSKACVDMKRGNKKFREPSRVKSIQNWAGIEYADTIRLSIKPQGECNF